MSERINPFSDLTDFTLADPKPKPGPAAMEAIDQVASDNGFPSRQPPKVAAAAVPPHVQRRHTTGRNQQLNIKATAATVEKFYRLADQHGVPLGEILARALDAMERSA